MLRIAALSLIICGMAVASGEENSSESAFRKLRKHLLENYDVNVRPVPHHDNLTVVTTGISPLHISEVNENFGIMTMECWVSMAWKDHNLKWNPAEFDGLDVIRLPENEVWKPDISVYNGRGNHISPWNSVRVLVYNDGSVMWIPPSTLHFICGNFDYTLYPRDTQDCNITLGTWTEDGDHLDVKLNEVDNIFDDYHSAHNPHWELISMYGSRKLKRYACCSEPYTTIVYKVKIQRAHVPSTALYATPDTVARVLILLMFWITSGFLKVLLGCTSLLLLSVISVGVMVTLPSPAAAPVALMPVSSAMSLCIAAMVVELLVISMATFRFSTPSFLDTISSSAFCQILTPCHHEEYREELVGESSSPHKKNNWPLIATVVDRIAFIVFAVLVSAL